MDIIYNQTSRYRFYFYCWRSVIYCHLPKIKIYPLTIPPLIHVVTLTRVVFYLWAQRFLKDEYQR